MTDREMLELAAKAAGLNIKAERVDSDDAFMCFVVGRKGTREKVDWNPLDITTGDALRLAARLQIELRPGEKSVTAAASGVWVEVPYGDGPEELAWCCAIVRAAAEIGQSMS